MTDQLRYSLFLSLTILFILTPLIGKVDLPFSKRPKVKEIREWIKNLPAEDREEGIASFQEQYGKPFLEKTRNQSEYKAPSIQDEDTQEFVFKKTALRDLKVFVDYPKDWKPGDKRPAIILWHGGGFTQGNAGQFYYQANYFTQRGAVCFRPNTASAISITPYPSMQWKTASARYGGSKNAQVNLASIPNR